MEKILAPTGSKIKVFNNLTHSMREKHQHTESAEQPHLTKPDQSMTTREIYTRYVKGLPITGSSLPENNQLDPENAMGVNPKTLDLIDLQEQKWKNQQKIDSLGKKAKDEQKSKEDKKQLDENSGTKTTKTDLPPGEDPKTDSSAQ